MTGNSAKTTRTRTPEVVLHLYGQNLYRFLDRVALEAQIADKITGNVIVGAARRTPWTRLTHLDRAATGWERVAPDVKIARSLATSRAEPLTTSRFDRTRHGLEMIDRADVGTAVSKPVAFVTARDAAVEQIVRKATPTQR